MTEQVPSIPLPEQESTPEGGLFRLEAMTDTQINETYTALWNHLDFTIANGRAIGPERSRASHSLVHSFAADLRGLSTSDPERLRNLVAQSFHGEGGPFINAAASTVDALIDYDYEFTRDSLTAIIGYDFPRNHDEYSFWDDAASERATDTVLDLMRNRLTPQQAAEFKASLVARHMWTSDFESAASGR